MPAAFHGSELGMGREDAKRIRIGVAEEAFIPVPADREHGNPRIDGR